MTEALAEPAFHHRPRDEKRHDDEENRRIGKPGIRLGGVRRPVRTAPAAANTDAVRIGNAPTTTDAIVAKKIPNNRHASRVNP
jgi:hypothetical protein